MPASFIISATLWGSLIVVIVQETTALVFTNGRKTLALQDRWNAVLKRLNERILVELGDPSSLIVLKSQSGDNGCEADNQEGYSEYCGELQSEGLRQGLGVLSWINGANYAGEWVEDKPEGYGCEQYCDGSVYAGQFQNALRHGLGQYRTKGYQYNGNWREGVRHGSGIECTFIEGELHEMFSIYRNGELKSSREKTLENSGRMEMELQYLLSITRKVINSVHGLIEHVHRHDIEGESYVDPEEGIQPYSDENSNEFVASTNDLNVDHDLEEIIPALSDENNEGADPSSVKYRESSAPSSTKVMKPSGSQDLVSIRKESEISRNQQRELWTPAVEPSEMSSIRAFRRDEQNASLILHDDGRQRRETAKEVIKQSSNTRSNQTSLHSKPRISGQPVISQKEAEKNNRQDQHGISPVISTSRPGSSKLASRAVSANSQSRNQLAELVRQMVDVKINSLELNPAEVLADKLIGLFSGESKKLAEQLEAAKKEVLVTVQSELRNMIGDLREMSKDPRTIDSSRVDNVLASSTIRTDGEKNEFRGLSGPEQLLNKPNPIQDKADTLTSVNEGAKMLQKKEIFVDEKTGDTYEGTFSKGYYHGQGKLVTKCGITYEGEFVNGMKHGFGTLSWPSNDMAFARYEGEFASGKKHGRGIEDLGKESGRNVTYVHGRLQSDGVARLPQIRLSTPQMAQPITFRNVSIRSRKGRQKFQRVSSGSKSVSTVQEHEPPSTSKEEKLPALHNAKGREASWIHDSGPFVTRLQLPDDVIYIGNVHNEIPHGLGVAIFPQEPPDPEGRVEYAGEFRGGWRFGLGCMQWLDGTSYVGEWKRDHASGFGQESYPDGSIYQGTFLNDQRDGMGVYQYADGTRHVGLWQHGRQMQSEDLQTNKSAGQYDKASMVETEGPLIAKVVKIRERAMSKTAFARAVAGEWLENEVDHNDGGDMPLLPE